MRRDVFTAAKACLALGVLAALALLLAPLPSGSTRYAEAREQRLAATPHASKRPLAAPSRTVADVRKRRISSNTKKTPQAERALQLAATDTAKSPLRGFASPSKDDAAAATDAVDFRVVEETPIDMVPIDRLVPEPTPDPAPVEQIVQAKPQPNFADEIRELRTEVLRLAQAKPDQPTDRADGESAELRNLIDEMRNSERFRQLEAEVRRLQSRSDDPKPSPADGESPSPSKSAPGKILVSPQTEQGEEPASAASGDGPFVRAVPTSPTGDRFTLQVEAAEVTQVLDLLGQMAGWNVVAAPDVEGQVTLNLRDVTLEEALEAILTPRDLVAEKRENLLYVFSWEEATRRVAAARTGATIRAAADRVLVTKIYRPNYVNVEHLQKLIVPLLTFKENIKVMDEEDVKKAVLPGQTIGNEQVATTSAKASRTVTTNSHVAGVDDLLQGAALLVQDYPEVIGEIDNLISELDVPPLQVVIDAVILRAELDDRTRFGVNFAMLRNSGQDLVVSGDPGGGALGPLASVIGNVAGLRYGFLHGDVTGFIEALEEISETSLVASPQLRVLNKQQAELIIGRELGYKTQTFLNQQTIESVQFLPVGTKLTIRPHATPDGLIRMEVHPEKSSGFIDGNGVPQTDTTQVTTNVMVRDGATVVIGGLIDEQTEENVSQIPLLGSIPIVGYLFRNTQERLVRSELIVLITPRIVCDPIEESRGEVIRAESEQRAAYFSDNLSPVSRRNLSRLHTERATELYEQGRLVEAHDHARHALSVRKNDGDALRLKTSIEGSLKQRTKRFFFWDRSDPEPIPVPPVVPVPDEAYWTEPPPGAGRVVMPADPLLIPPAPEPEPTLAPLVPEPEPMLAPTFDP